MSATGDSFKSDQITHTCLLREKETVTPVADYSSMFSDYQTKQPGRLCASQAERI